MDNQTPFTPIPQEQTFAHNHCLSDPQTSTYAHPTPPLNLYTTLDFPQQAQEPASNLAFLLPWQPPQPQPSDIPHNPAPMLGNISSSMGTPSLNSQYYCNPSYNTDLPIQPSVSLCQPLPLRSHGPCQQPLLAVESVSDIMLNNVPSTNSGIYDFDSQLRGTPLMPNTTIPLQNPTLNNYLCPPEPIGGESLLQPQQQQQRMDVDDDLAQDTSHFLVHQTQPSQLHSQQHHSFYLSNSLVIDSDQAAEVQRVTDILYTPPASPFLNSLNSGDTISQEQMAPETQELSFADRKRRGSDNHRQRGHKRQKKAIQLQKKLEIIEYWEQNQNASYQKIGEHFCIPRTTIHGIVKNREILRDHAKSKPRAGLTMETSRMVEPRFRILEEVLMTWITDLRSRCAPISGWKITGQAFNIHRMLSELPAEPLPPCQFTSGWLKNFKKRRHISLEAMHRNMIASDDFERAFKEVRGHIAGYAINRIYTCGVTSMYLTAIPMVVFQDEKKKKKKVFQDEGQNCQTNNVDSASASVLFCSNADGSDKRKPLVLVRYSGGILETEDHRGMVVDASVEDMTATVFRKWITDFSSTLDDGVVLLVDETVWRLLETESSGSREMIGKVKVIKVPLQLHSLLPMAAGITEELKANYHVLLMEKWKSVVAQSVNIAIEDYLRLIPDAWSRVPESTFKRTFQKFIPDESGSCPSDEPNVTEPDQKQSMVTKLQVALRDVSPAIPESVLQYYLNQDNDTGPSGFLRAKILEMNLPEDSECCFGTTNFGVVRFGRGNLRQLRASGSPLTGILIIPSAPHTAHRTSFLTSTTTRTISESSVTGTYRDYRRPVGIGHQ